MKKTIVALGGMICLTVIIVSAHAQGINGAVTSAVVGLIGTIAGAMIGFSIKVVDTFKWHKKLKRDLFRGDLVFYLD